jgi:hypothetical protein
MKPADVVSLMQAIDEVRVFTSELYNEHRAAGNEAVADQFLSVNSLLSVVVRGIVQIRIADDALTPAPAPAPDGQPAPAPAAPTRKKGGGK